MEAMGQEQVMEAMGHEQAMGESYIVEAMGYEHVVWAPFFPPHMVVLLTTSCDGVVT